MAVTGVKDVLAGLDRVQRSIQADVREVTSQTLRTVRERAYALCRRGIEPGPWPGHVRDQLRWQISRDLPQGAVWVERRSSVASGKIGGRYGTDNVGLWLEYGTSQMDAKPYLRPAVDTERRPYEMKLRAATDRATRRF